MGDSPWPLPFRSGPITMPLGCGASPATLAIPDETRRLLALATIYCGGSRSEAAAIGGVGLQTVRDWVVRFNQDGVAGLLNGKALRSRPPLDAVRWRLVDLMGRVFEEFRISISKQT